MVLVAGVDEAGTGALAGPVVAAAVILDPEKVIKGLADSKLLPEETRERLEVEIKERAKAWSVGSASVEEIDSLGIVRANMLAMKRAVVGLPLRPDEVWVDGQKKPSLEMRTRCFVDGDRRFGVISAASILAKVERDRRLLALSHQYPAYRFDLNKGYFDYDHVMTLKTIGPSPVHRRSFRPVAEALNLDLFIHTPVAA